MNSRNEKGYLQLAAYLVLVACFPIAQCSHTFLTAGSQLIIVTALCAYLTTPPPPTPSRSTEGVVVSKENGNGQSCRPSVMASFTVE